MVARFTLTDAERLREYVQDLSEIHTGLGCLSLPQDDRTGLSYAVLGVMHALESAAKRLEEAK